MRATAGASAALLLLAAAVVVWIRLLPLGLPAVPEPAAAEFRYADAGGREHVFLGDYDSYAWLRAARNLLRTGSACDAQADGVCHDTYTLAPLGLPMPHPHSLHTAAIAAVQRVATSIDPTFPLPASAYLVPVLVGVLGVLPAFAVGRRLAGPAAGFIAALTVSLQPLFLTRSIGSDNDVWNVVLPLYLIWAVLGAVWARRTAIQIGLAALASLVTGLHAMTWHGWTFGCTVILTGLAAAIVLESVRWTVRQRTARVWRSRLVRSAVTVALVYAVGAAVCTTALAGDDWLLRAPRRLLGGATVISEVPAAANQLRWPSALAGVSELSVPSLGAIAAQCNGYIAFFAGWIGIVLLLLPRHGWRTGHFAVLIGATVLYRVLLTWNGLGRVALSALLLLPLAAALLVDLREGDLEPDELAGAVLIIIWFIAALAISYEALRFVMLLAAPLGLATGVAVGRALAVLDDEIRTRVPARTALRHAVGAAALLGVAAAPVSAGYRTARAYLPSVDRSWAETFAGLRTTAPPDAIINAWWDYGHWAKYFAERRVATDGATLLTHVPHWIARAELAADEAESVGILRMLDCGSDAEPYPEASRGAYGKLVRQGVAPRDAYDLLVRIARLDRTAADEMLAAAGLSSAARQDVLAASHCDPPAARVLPGRLWELPLRIGLAAIWVRAACGAARSARSCATRRRCGR